MDKHRRKPINRRLLVANTGPKIDTQLIRYASMVASLWGSSEPLPTKEGGQSSTPLFVPPPGTAARRTETTLGLASRPAPRRALDVEVRFLALSPKGPEHELPEAARLTRLKLRSQVDRHFRGTDEKMVVGCDVLRGKTLPRLLSYMTDFDGDVLLLGRDGWTGKQLARMVMEAPYAVWAVPRDWAPVLRRILVPIDFNSRAVHSLRAAIHLARRYPTAKCTVLHVDRHDTRCSGDEIGTARLRELMAAYNELMHAVDSAGVHIAPLFVKDQFIERAVARAASEHSADLVVTSSRGRSRLAGALHSSIAAQTLREVPGAILTLKPEGASLSWPDALRGHWKQAGSPHFS